MNDYYKKDLYAILGVAFDADDNEIKSAYRKLARIWHPDVNDNSSESIEKFKEITEAYEVLIDTQKRSQYDIIQGVHYQKTSSSYTKASQAKKAYSSSSNTTSQSRTAYEKSYEDYKREFSRNTEKTATENESNIDSDASENKDSVNKSKSSFSQVFENIMDSLFTSDAKTSASSKKTTKKKLKPENGKDINLNVNIKLSEAISGTNRTINVIHTERCPKCEGRRFINGAKCPLCKGSGEVSNHKKLNVKIPAGVKKGAKIRIADEGNKGYNGGKNGDLYLFVEIEESKFFQFDGLNVFCEIPITPFEAALGATIDVPTVCGCVSMKVPPNTSTGQKFRLSGEGLQDKKSKKNGDQIVTVKIEMPKTLSEEEKKLYERLRTLSNYNVRENLLDD